MSQHNPWPDTPPTAPGAPPPFTPPVPPPSTSPTPPPGPPTFGTTPSPRTVTIRRAPTDRRLVVLSVVLAITSLTFGMLWVKAQAHATDLQDQLDLQAAGAAASAGASAPPDLSPSTSTSTPTSTTAPSSSTTAPTGPTHVLVVGKDGCAVERSTTKDEPWDLTWTIRNGAGFQVLGRNAKDERTYRYFETGTYTVTLTTWDDGKARPVSNTVTITC